MYFAIPTKIRVDSPNYLKRYIEVFYEINNICDKPYKSWTRKELVFLTLM